MAKGQPKKPTMPRVGDVAKVTKTDYHMLPLGSIVKIVAIGEFYDCHCLTENKVDQYLRADQLFVFRGGAATNIRRKHDKDFKDAE